MKCNPLRWLFGLIPLAILWWVTQIGSPARLEADLGLRVREHLDRNGLQWANVEFKGRDALITGRAEEESDQRRPALETAKVWGVRTLEDRIDVLQLVKNYVWTAAVNGNELALGGHIPNEAARKAILSAAKTSLPKMKVDDKMDLARGAPEQKVFISGAQFALAQLAGLKSGGKAQLEAAAISVQGEADSARGYETIKSALARALPAGISLKQERIIPPAVSPYTWAAALRSGRVELTGHAPSEAARDALKAAAGRALPGGTVVDRMTLASGAPGDWQKVATSAIGRLGQLTQGNAEMVDTQLTVTGLAPTEEEADRIRRALRSDVPQSIRLTERITQDPAVKAAEEAAKRAAADAEARRVAESQRLQGDEQARQRAEAEAARRRGEEETQRRRAQEDAQRKAAADAEAQRHAAEERAKAEAQAKARQAEAARCQTGLTSATENGTILFRRASADLDRSSHKTLDELARLVKNCPGLKIEVAGHTDNEGVPERNQRWSDLRAKAVRDYLVQAGVSAETLHAVGYGETRPKAPNDTPENMAKNRRIEFTVKTR